MCEKCKELERIIEAQRQEIELLLWERQQLKKSLEQKP